MWTPPPAHPATPPTHLLRCAHVSITHPLTHPSSPTLHPRAGFCGETEEEHLATLDLMRRTAYDQAFMFAYSDREKTYAARHLQVGPTLFCCAVCVCRCAVGGVGCVLLRSAYVCMCMGCGGGRASEPQKCVYNCKY